MSRLYYLIATLPDFDPIDAKTPLDSDDIIRTILDNTEEELQAQVRLMLSVNDIRNLIIYFTNKSGTSIGNPLPYSPSLIKLEEFEDWKNYKEILPEFLYRILDEKFSELSNLNEADLTSFLWTEYFKEIELQKSHLKLLMQNYIVMHDLLGLIRSKNLNLGLWDHWIGFEAQLEDLKSGRLTISGLAQEHENFNNLKIKSLESEPMEAESWSDELLIRKSAENLGSLPFDEAHLLHYTFKLLIGSKWRSFQNEEGLSRLNKLKSDLISDIKIPLINS